MVVLWSRTYVAFYQIGTITVDVRVVSKNDRYAGPCIVRNLVACIVALHNVHDAAILSDKPEANTLRRRQPNAQLCL